MERCQKLTPPAAWSSLPRGIIAARLGGAGGGSIIGTVPRTISGGALTHGRGAWRRRRRAIADRYAACDARGRRLGVPAAGRPTREYRDPRPGLADLPPRRRALGRRSGSVQAD